MLALGKLPKIGVAGDLRQSGLSEQAGGSEVPETEEGVSHMCWRGDLEGPQVFYGPQTSYLLQMGCEHFNAFIFYISHLHMSQRHRSHIPAKAFCCVASCAL